MGKRIKHRFWTVVETWEQDPREANRAIVSLGFETYRPRYRGPFMRGVREILPLFPNYVFIRIDDRVDDWKRIPSTRGVKQMFITGSGAPARVRDADIAALVACQDQDGYVVIPEYEPPSFSIAQSVRALHGLFAEREGEFRGLAPNKHFARVVFEMFGNDIEVELNLHELVAAGISVAA